MAISAHTLWYVQKHSVGISHTFHLLYSHYLQTKLIAKWATSNSSAKLLAINQLPELEDAVPSIWGPTIKFGSSPRPQPQFVLIINTYKSFNNDYVASGYRLKVTVVFKTNDLARAT